MVIGFTGGLGAVSTGLFGGLSCLGVGFLLWRFGVLGAGDVKVMSVLALSLPWARSLEFLFYSLVWGSVLGAVALLLDKTLFQESRVLNFHPMMTIRSQRVKNHKIPFTVGILFGILTVWLLDSKGVYFL
jgi:prepilin peptidase CpaA